MYSLNNFYIMIKYNNISMHSKIWGPFCWHIMHIVTYNYPIEPTEKHKNTIKKFFTSLRYILPCIICRQHYSKKLVQHPITRFYNDKRKLIEWCINMHNEVNRIFKRRSYSVQDSDKLYLHKGKVNYCHYKIFKFIELMVITCPKKVDSKKLEIGYIQCFNTLTELIPCRHCRNLYKNALTKYPLTIETVNDTLKLRKWYSNIEYFQNDHKFNETDQLLSYKYYYPKKRIEKKMIYEMHLNNVDKLENLEHIPAKNKTYNVVQTILFKDGTKKSLTLLSNIPKGSYIKNVNITNKIEESLHKVKKSVPKSLRR